MAQEIGVETVYGSVCVRAFSGEGVLRLAFDDTGTFDVRGVDRSIAWYPGPGAGAGAPAIRADLLGRVIALAAHADGGLALHASAVSIDGVAVAFLGPKHAGKSTLALALVRRGARLITDDTLVVPLAAARSASVVPGVQRVRLWPDAARALGVPIARDAGAKPTIDPLAPAQLEPSEVPLAACYVLRPDAGPMRAVPVSRQRLTPVHATMAGVRFSKLGALVGGGEGQLLLDRAARLGGATTFFDASAHRDLRSLDLVADQVIEWHTAAASGIAELAR